MNALHRPAPALVAIALSALCCALTLPAAASAAEPAVDQYRPAASGGSDDTQERNLGGGNHADLAATATAPDFNVVRNDTREGGEGGLTFLIALGVGLLSVGVLAAWRRHRGPARPPETSGPAHAGTATHTPSRG